ncbi:MAG: type II secretion system minor pseudopilin GspK [Deltaproteobacteria bacterium]|nr:type II secretion system minor pseudopilin GspK [Deltaproteobacteria bacterium]
MTRTRRRQGVVLFIVLFFTLLLTASIATFVKRATVDAILSRNRDAMARTEALARGGIELAKAVLIQDRLADVGSGTERLDSHKDSWARAADIPIDIGNGARLRLRIEDSGSRFNLNALFNLTPGKPGASAGAPTELFLLEFFEKVIDELPVDEKGLYDARDLVENLIDYVDHDDTRIGGGFEDDYYQKQSPPYRAANRPLLSVDELGLVEGFDPALVKVLRPYVTVYPYVNGRGVNPNTAPPHILSLIYYHDGVDFRLAKEDDVRRILEVRKNGKVFCQSAQPDECVSISDILPNVPTIYPPLGFFSDTFSVRSEARFANVVRTVEAVIDRSTPSEPVLLSWKVR